MPEVINAFTDLVLDGVGVQPYSARGLSQTLTPIQQAAPPKRTVNGKLKDIGLAQFKKYASTISCTDQAPPVFDGAWPGLQVTVDCVVPFSRVTAAAPERPIVPDSEYEDGGFTLYRPRLIMRIMTFDVQKDEYGAAISWNMTLEEV